MGNSSSASSSAARRAEQWEEYRRRLAEWEETVAAQEAEEAAERYRSHPGPCALTTFWLQQCCGMLVEIPLREVWHGLFVPAAAGCCLVAGAVYTMLRKNWEFKTRFEAIAAARLRSMGGLSTAELKAAFDAFDIDKAGTLDVSELKRRTEWDGREGTSRAQLLAELEGRLNRTDANAAQIVTVAEQLRSLGVKRIGLCGDNTPAWVVADLACLMADVVCVPVPVFFSRSQTEHLIQRAMPALTEGRTTLVIAHRLATVRDADRIAVFDEGRLLAVGSHDQLIRDNPLYRRLASLQFRDTGSQTEH